MNTWFRNPVENAAVLIEVCGSVEAARDMARTNALFVSETEDAEFWYWIAVRDALIPEKACRC
jgi:hypothetical protein